MSEQRETSETDYRLLEGLAEPAQRLMDYHLANAKVWYPHESIPWDNAKNYKPGESWNPEEFPLADGVRSALIVNLLTEDNLPYYTHDILGLSPEDHPLSAWTHRWTAEEGRHSQAIRDWLLVTRAVDPRKLEDDRIIQVQKGEVPVPESLADTLAYVSFQELATQVAHRNTGRKIGKTLNGSLVMAQVAGDEKLHHEFYRNLTTEAFAVEPSTMVLAIMRRLANFKMPGTGIPDFATHQEAISKEGIFSRTILTDDVFVPTLQIWKPELEKLTDLSSEADEGRELLFKKLEQMERILQKRQAKQLADANS